MVLVKAWYSATFLQIFVTAASNLKIAGIAKIGQLASSITISKGVSTQNDSNPNFGGLLILTKLKLLVS